MSKTMRLRKLVIQGIIVSVLVIGFGLTAIMSGLANSNQSPTSAQVTFAQQTSDLMLNTLFAALTQEFDETTVENVEQGKHSISLIFNDRNRDMRLVGTVDPLREDDRPSDAFEIKANALAMSAGQSLTDVQRVQGQWYYRRSIPLTNFRAECALCHVNFPSGPTADRVGALMLRLPIQRSVGRD